MNYLKKIDNEKYLYSLFRGLSKEKEIEASLHFKDGNIFSGKLLLFKRGNELYFKTNSCIIANSESNEVLITLINKENMIIFETMISGNIDDCYILTKPKYVYASFRRHITRHKTDSNENVYIYFPDKDKKYKVLDINSRGLSFSADELIFEEGQNIENVVLKINNKEINFDCNIRYRRKLEQNIYIYGLNFINIDWSLYTNIYSYIFNKRYSNIKLLPDYSSDEIFNLFQRSGYFSVIDNISEDELKIFHYNMIQILEKIKNNFQLFFNPVYCKEDNTLLSTGSVIRIYNHTFLGQHLASIPEARLIPKAKTEIYLCISDFLLNHPHFEFYLAYIHADLEWHHEMYYKVGQCINDDNKFLFDTLELFECNIDEISQDVKIKKDYIVNTGNHKDFIDYCKTYLKPIEMDSYSYNEDFTLNELKQLYQASGLYLERELHCVSKDNEILAYAVSEVYTNGLSFFNFPDMCRIYLTNENVDIDAVLKAVLPHIAAFFSKHDKKRFNILLKIDSEKIQNINIEGVKYSFLLGRVIFNREGVADYYKILSFTSM